MVLELQPVFFFRTVTEASRKQNRKKVHCTQI